MLYTTIAKFWRLFVEIIAMFSVAFTVYQFAFNDGKQMVMSSMSSVSHDLSMLEQTLNTNEIVSSDLKFALSKIISSLEATGMKNSAQASCDVVKT
ncbi:MAG: hypothetical protein COB13_001580 [OCS116 cluster bacterium]|uniref:Uncharacterized protein n=1 Tax=OCS116 cluster bacterium TaxID=2030921 RepID=A0A2A4Z8Y8_9PROT|nr:hypothetical protein [OCS116 cluster bacterium]